MPCLCLCRWQISLIHCWVGASRHLPVLIHVGWLQSVARTHPIPERSKFYTHKMEVLHSGDLRTGSAKAAKACVRIRRAKRSFFILAQLLQPWWWRLPEACIEVGEDEEEDGYEGEEDHASWGCECGLRRTNLRRWTAACKTLTSPAWESNRWCPTGNVTASIVCSFIELLQLGFAAWLTLKCVVFGQPWVWEGCIM